MEITQFRDRTEAGQLLAAQLATYVDRPDVLVLALPRGGVLVAFEVARVLHAPLDVLVVRKLGVPGQEELAMGAIAAGGARFLNDDVVQFLGISDEVIDQAAEHEQRELERRERLYRGDRPACDARGFGSSETAAACPRHHCYSNGRSLNVRGVCSRGGRGCGSYQTGAVLCSWSLVRGFSANERRGGT